MSVDQHTQQSRAPISELLASHPVDSVIVNRLGDAVWHTTAFFEKFDADFIRDVLLRLDCEKRATETDERSVFHLLYSRSVGDFPREYTVAAQKTRENHWIISIADRELMDSEAARTEREHAMLTKMLAVFAHEFRNPLVSVELVTGLLQESAGWPTPDENVSAKLDTLGDGIKQMKRLLNDLEDYQRFSRGKISIRKQLFDLRPVIVSIAREHQLKGQTHLRFHEDGPATAPIYGDEDRIRQVITNVIGNALKFSPNNTPVDVYLGRIGGTYCIEIKDQGVGMSDDTISHITKPFFQVPQGLSRERGGLGLGTYICKIIVDLHNGNLTYTSDGENCGTRVLIHLPAGSSVLSAEPQEQQVTALSRKHTPERRSVYHPKVLIVEDHQSCLNAYRMALEDCHSVEIYYAASGKEALTLLRNHHFSLVITDLGLPDISGYGLIESYHAEAGQGPPTEFVLVTGYGSDEERSKSKALGFTEHIVKPLPLEKLRTLVLNQSHAKATYHESNLQ